MIDNTNYSFLNQRSPISLVSYCDGPAVSRPTGLFSGEYFSGRYAIFLNTDGWIISRSLVNQEEIAIRSSTGIYTNYLTGVVNSSVNGEFSNIASCFDNNCQPVVAIQNNSINGAYIYLAYNSGLRVTGWSGYNPAVYNTANINYPLSVPTPIFPTFKSGQIACYYTNATGSILYARYSKDNFYQEYALHSGLATGFVLNFAGSAFTIRESNIKDYPSYVKRLYAYDTNRNLVTYTSYPSVSYAMDNLERYTTGTISGLTSGWGRWMRLTSFNPSIGYFWNIDSYFYDTFELYTTGSIALLNANFSLKQASLTSPNILYSGLTRGYFASGEFYTTDNLESYITGSINYLTGARNVNAVLRSGYFTGNLDLVAWDNFEAYANSGYFSGNLYINSGISFYSGITFIP